MSRRRRPRLSETGRFMGTVVAAGAIGAWVGIGLGALSGGDDTPAIARASARTTATTSAPAASPPRRAGVRVVSSVLTPAGSVSGQTRRRARLTIRVRLTNRRSTPIAVPVASAALRVAARVVRPDPNASDAAGALGRPIPAGRRASGELRFETAGSVTDSLTLSHVAVLSFGGKNTNLRIIVGPPVVSGG